MGDKMGCQVLWSFQNNLGIEHLRLMRLSDSIVAESIVVGVVNNKALRAQYKIRCDLSWCIREIDICSLDNESKPLHCALMERGIGVRPRAQRFTPLTDA